MGAWLAFTLVMIGLQVKGASDRIALDQREQHVNETEARVAAYRGSVDEHVARVERRQAVLDELVSSHFGDLEIDEDAVAESGETAVSDAERSALPESAELERLERRQIAFARRLRNAVEARTLETADAIREFGLDPLMLASQAMGGPLRPVHTATVPGGIDSEIADLEIALNQLSVMEVSLRAIPSAQPTSYGSMSSPFGLRRDPFTRGRAMHTGIDFRGTRGQGILATGPGRVIFAGWKGGYGRAIEVDHGAGVVTRYAHLSGIDVTVGQEVDRGDRIGRMGSTGRSTSTHLHYEVRINGRAVNPRPLLEADRDVLEIQSGAERRNGDTL
ncbi:M23 family metallopeptidase [Parasphingopyxis marina]|uniref:M23 family metallopeptidase n=1 Tax=Parasphingopyxis marina TaxID=2761622 RepID=A0A842HV78_9SPHN|nr:M23 family metallopeptidase [Parasphingopyxis marina]MBC2776872.1 M23 family metallopeptidase [Parasphingopyxis marina]